ncbi:MAG: LysM peptidoglycan-binding domain-containing protein, partial [Prevotella sp.]
LYDIAQRYGIRLKSLVKKNEKIAERGLRIGDEVILY